MPVTRVKTHTDNPSTCPIVTCGRVFARSTDRDRHMKIHSQTRDFKCDYPNCTFSTNQRTNLKTHQNMHTGAKPYKCNDDPDNCIFASGDRSCLLRHRSRLHGYKPSERKRKALASLPKGSSESGPSNGKQYRNPAVPAGLRRIINDESKTPVTALDQFHLFAVEPTPSPPSPAYFNIPELSRSNSRSSSTSSLESLNSNYALPATPMDLAATPAQPLFALPATPNGTVFSQDQQLDWSWNMMSELDIANALYLSCISGNACVDDKFHPGTHPATNLATNPAYGTTGLLYESHGELVNYNAFAHQPSYQYQYQHQYQEPSPNPTPYVYRKPDISSSVIRQSTQELYPSFPTEFSFGQFDNSANLVSEINPNMFAQVDAPFFPESAPQAVPTMEAATAFPQFGFSPGQFEPQVEPVQPTMNELNDYNNYMSQYIDWNGTACA